MGFTASKKIVSSNPASAIADNKPDTQNSANLDNRPLHYNMAMQKYPKAKEAEYRALFYRNPLRENERIAEVLSNESPYFKRFIPQHIEIDNFTDAEGIQNIERKYDRAICLNKLHAVGDKEVFIAQVGKIVVSGGLIHLVDVSDESGIKNFLKEFVSENSNMQFKDNFLPFTRKINLPSNVQMIRREMMDVYWEFNNYMECAEYCRLLFSLNALANNNKIMNALEQYVGILEQGRKISVKWRLQYIDLKVVF